ncbi:MAG: T9SS type A sorting domain-containing protein [Bacteroidales bacterium]|nr:T9SS type A sorting domain-containing protein [Bacteroidales bacterium]
MKNIIIILVSILITVNCFAQEQDSIYTGNLTNATPTESIDFGDIGGHYNDVFYKFTPTENSIISIILGNRQNKEIFLFDLDNPTEELASSYNEEDDEDNNIDTLTYNCQAGITYLIRVIDYKEFGGNFTLKLKDVTPVDIATDIAGMIGGVVSGDGTYMRGTECFVSAVSDDCHYFVNWTEGGNEVCTDEIYSFYVQSNRTLVANFELIEYEIYSSAENGTITPTPTQTVICGENSQPFTFYPIDDCYEFDKLYVDAEEVSVSSNSYTFPNVKEGYTIFATFKKIQYPITSSNGLHGIIEPWGTEYYFCGDTIIYCFVPQSNPEYELYYIVVDGDTIYANSNLIVNNCYTFIVTEQHNIHAVFKRVSFTITTIPDAHCTITPGGTIPVFKGDNQIFLIEITDACYEIDSVFINGVFEENLTVIMKYAIQTTGYGVYTFLDVSTNCSIRIVTKQIEFNILSSSENGTISPAPTQSVTCGENNTFTFLFYPDYCYELDKLYVDGVPENAVGDTAYTFSNVNANHTIFALFKKKQIEIISSSSAFGYIEPSGTTNVYCGDSINYCFYPQPNPESELYYIVVDGDTIYADQITNNCYTFENVTEPHNIHTVFKKITFTIFAEADTHSTITPSGFITIDKGESFTFTNIIVTDNCYEIESVFIDGSIDTDATNSVSWFHEYTFPNVTFDRSIRISTQQKEFEILSSSENGTITPTPKQDVICGKNQTFTFSPLDDSYEFNGLFVDDLPAVALGDTAYTFTNVTENHTIFVKFKQKPLTTYTIYPSAGLHGQIDPSYAISVEEGENQQFCFYPEIDYVVNYVMIDDTIVHSGDTTCYTIENVMADHTIYVSFCKKTSIEDVEPSFIKIYPNPVDNLLIIECSELKFGDKIDIFDVSGKLVLSLNINETNKVSVDVGGLNSGTYIFKIGHLNGKFVKK